VALGHIHKAQNLNENAHPPVIYPGSIERVDFGEASDDKFYVIAEVSRGKTRVVWRQLTGVRPFIDAYLRLEATQPPEGLTDRLREALPSQEQLRDAIVRLTVEFPRAWESLIDDSALQNYAAGAFEFRLTKHPQMDVRLRLPQDQAFSSLNFMEQLETYWRTNHLPDAEIEQLARLAAQVISRTEAGE
jgi:exonuclease SbcD